ncbi:MAG: hypothetical protein MJA31_09585 [Clostridia bacterium]|nr:hypothetical protein [Clostridia bacterium]
MKIDSIINMPKENIQNRSLEGKEKEAFKKIFVENMVKEMLKDTNMIPSSNETEKEFYMDKISELLSDKLMESTDIRWQEILKMNDKE